MEDVIDILPVSRAHEVRKSLYQAAKNVSENYIELAELLYESKENDYHTKWGYTSFHDYLERELDVGSRKGGFLLGIAKTVKRLDIDWNEVRAAGWRKIGVVYPLMNNENYQEMIELAENNSLNTLVEKTKEIRKGKKEVQEEEQETLIKVTFKMNEDEQSILIAAIEEAMKQEGINNKTQAIVTIAYQWLMEK